MSGIKPSNTHNTLGDNDIGKKQQLEDLENKMRNNFRAIQFLTAMNNLQCDNSGLTLSGLSPQNPQISTQQDSPTYMFNNLLSYSHKKTDSEICIKPHNTSSSEPDIIPIACMARRSDGKQCTKPKHTRIDPNTDYCNIHHSRQVYGRIDSPIPDGVKIRASKSSSLDTSSITKTKCRKSDNMQNNGLINKRKSKPNTTSKYTDSKKTLKDKKIAKKNAKKNKTKITSPSNESLNIDDNNANEKHITINDDVEDKTKNTAVKPPPKKRGRKRKHPIDPRFNNPAYVTMWPEIISGEKRLVDKYDRVYTYDPSTPVYLGKKTVDNQLVEK